jgi:hypothetical protein
MSKTTQCERVLAYIKEFGSISQIEALRDISCMILASRIADLKKQGFDIISKTEAVNNRYGEKCYIKRCSFAVK